MEILCTKHNGTTRFRRYCQSVAGIENVKQINVVFIITFNLEQLALLTPPFVVQYLSR